MRRSDTPIRALFLGAALLVGASNGSCSSLPIRHEPDSVEITLPAPADQVRLAVAQVLSERGYPIRSRDDRVISTGYREEMDSIWDRLLVRIFGAMRSRVQAMLTPDGETATRLRIEVISEGKTSLFSSWRPFETPLPQSATTQLRLVKNALGLL